MAVCALSSGRLSSGPAVHSELTNECPHSISFQPSTETDYSKRLIHTPMDSYHRSPFSTVVWDSPLYPEQRILFYASKVMPTYLSCRSQNGPVTQSLPRSSVIQDQYCLCRDVSSTSGSPSRCAVEPITISLSAYSPCLGASLTNKGPGTPVSSIQ